MLERGKAEKDLERKGYLRFLRGGKKKNKRYRTNRRRRDVKEACPAGANDLGRNALWGGDAIWLEAGRCWVGGVGRGGSIQPHRQRQGDSVTSPPRRRRKGNEPGAEQSRKRHRDSFSCERQRNARSPQLNEERRLA